MKKRKLILSGVAVIAMLFASGSKTFANTVTVPTDVGAEGGAITFGTVAGATFNGTGIDNTQLKIFTNGDTTLALGVTPRFQNGPVTNNGADTYYTNAGGDTLNGKPNYAQFNFDYYASGIASDSILKLYYGPGTSLTNFVTLGGPDANGVYQDSFNFGFGFLGGPGGAFGATGFDPLLAQTIGVALVVENSFGIDSFADGIVIKDGIPQSTGGGGTNSVPDTGTTFGLLLLSFLGIAFIHSRMRKDQGSFQMTPA